MDRFSKPLDAYLRLAHGSALLVSKADMANLDILLTMLGPIDRDILCAYYGLFDIDQQPVPAIAARYRIKPAAIEEIVTKDLHRLGITPEWQMMLRQLRPMVRRRIGVE